MAKTSGFSKFTCDRLSCGKEEYIADADKTKSSQWMTVNRINEDRVEETSLLCSSCYSDYKKLVASQDIEINKFLRGE